MVRETQVSPAASDPGIGRGRPARLPRPRGCRRAARRAAAAAAAGLAALLLPGVPPLLSPAFAAGAPRVVADPRGGAEAANMRCPVLPAEDVDPDVSIAFEGRVLGFCCVKCLRKFEANPDAYREGVEQVLPVPVAAAAIGERMARTREHDHGHDHATGHRVGGGSRWIGWLGKLHPIVIHFPIGWILLAALVELAALMRRPDWLLPAGRQVLRLAAVSAAVAAPLGWAAASTGSYPGGLAEHLYWHRILGTGTASIVVLAAVVSEWAGRTGDRRLLGARRALVLLAGALVVVTGHLGGTLVFGEGFLRMAG